MTFPARNILVFYTLWLPFGANRTRCQGTCIDLTWLYTERWCRGAFFFKLCTHWSGIWFNTKVVLIISLDDYWLTTDWDALVSHHRAWHFSSTSKKQIIVQAFIYSSHVFHRTKTLRWLTALHAKWNECKQILSQFI